MSREIRSPCGQFLTARVVQPYGATVGCTGFARSMEVAGRASVHERRNEAVKYTYV